jgi:hypothetical protein
LGFLGIERYGMRKRCRVLERRGGGRGGLVLLCDGMYVEEGERWGKRGLWGLMWSVGFEWEWALPV